MSQVQIETIFDILDVQKNTAPGVLATQSGDLTTGKEWLMLKDTRVSKPSERDSRKAIAVTYLGLTKQHVEKSLELRKHYAKLAREYGLTNQEIGDELGMTEARVRQILAGA